MSLMISNKLTITDSNALFLKELQLKLLKQDNRCTSYPVWRVFEERFFVGVDKNSCDGMCVINKDTGDIYLELDKLIDDILYFLTDENGDSYTSIEWFLNDIDESIQINSLLDCYNFIINILDWDNYDYIPYAETFEFVDQFLTEEEANLFISNNKFKYKNNLIIRIESCWKNRELVQLLDMIKDL